jgi:hypothetical protein
MEKILEAGITQAEKKERIKRAVELLRDDRSSYVSKNRTEILDLISFDKNLIMSSALQEAAKDAIRIAIKNKNIEDASQVGKDFYLVKTESKK